MNRILEMGLSNEGFEVKTAPDGMTAITISRQFQPHIVILDIMMPGMDGFEVCRMLKKAGSVAVIMLTAKDEVDDRVKGLTLGADDYMSKPFSFEELLARIYALYVESTRMKKLVQDLLTLAQLDRSPHIQLADWELETLIEEMEPQLRLLAGNRGVSLHLASHSKCQVDQDKIKQVILNVFDNAVQHTGSEKGHIRLSLADVPGGIEIAVNDNGPGIAEKHLAHLFERFYRSDSSRTRKYGGAGLGLAISKSIVDLHGGSIRVESKEGAGSGFYVWLPCRRKKLD